MIVDDFLRYMLAEREASEETVTSYRRGLTEYVAFLQRHDDTLTVESADSDVVRDWIGYEMDRGLMASTVNRMLSAVKSLYRYALRQGLVSVDPAHNVTGPKKQKTLPVFLKQSEADELFDGIAWDMDDMKDVRERTLLLLLYTTGIRRGELAGLTDGDVDYVQRQIKVTGKRRKQRIVPLTGEMVAALHHYQSMRDSHTPAADATAAFFRNDKGLPLSRTQLYEVVHRRLSAVTTMQKRSPHVMRHTFATAMLNGGASLIGVQHLLGHESLNTTQVYTHVTFEDLQRDYTAAHPRAGRDKQ